MSVQQSMSPPPAARSIREPLTQAYIAYHTGNATEGLRCLQAVGQIDQNAVNAAHGHIYEIMNKPSMPYYGQKAFEGGLNDDQKPSTQKLAQAVGEVLIGAIRGNSHVPHEQTLRGQKAVRPQQYYAGGFDPRFTFDGASFTALRTSVSQKLTYAFFWIKSAFTWNAEKRQTLKLIGRCASLESALSASCQTALVDKPIDGLASIPRAELEFLESASALYKKLFPRSAGENPYFARLFPSELLRPLHITDMGSADARRDLPAIKDWVFARLNHSMYQDAADRANHLHVSYDQFVQVTQAAKEELKCASRELRRVLIKSVTDWKCARNYEACIGELREALVVFGLAWGGYVQSDELVREAHLVSRSRVSPRVVPYLDDSYNAVAACRAETENGAKFETQRTVAFLGTRPV